MIHHQPRGGQLLVEALTLAVLHHVVFVLGGGIVEDVGLSAVGKALESRYRGVAGQLDGVSPSGHHLLVGRVACGAVAVAVVIAAAHQVPRPHAVVAALRAVVVDVVQVSEAQAVGELMADGADALGQRGGAHLVGAGIDRHRVAVVGGQGGTELRLMWPYRVGVAARGLTPAGVQHINFLHLLVAVPVVGAEIDVGSVGRTHGSRDHSLRIGVAAVGVVGSVGGVGAEGIGTHHVEREVELAVALLREVVVDAADELPLAEALLVGHALVVGHRVGLLELHVGELHEDDESFLLSRIAHRGFFGIGALGGGSLAHRRRLLPPRQGLLAERLQAQGRERLKAVAAVEVGLPLLVLPVVQVLVARQPGIDRRAVLEEDSAPEVGLSGDGTGHNSHQQQDKRENRFLHIRWGL